MIAVFDGDTIAVIDESGDRIELRLAGINAPEDGECHHSESRDYLEAAVADLEIAYEVMATDQFGRLLAHVWVNVRHVNHDLVSQGQTIATTPDGRDPYGDALLDAETAAAEDDLGIWADDSCGRSDSHPQVTIDKVRADPAGRDEDDLDGEQVTLLNQGDSDVDLGGWILRDESSRHRYEFPSGTLLQTGGKITVSSADPGWRPGGGPVWNNGGDLVMLLDPSGRIIDHLRY